MIAAAEDQLAACRPLPLSLGCLLPRISDPTSAFSVSPTLFTTFCATAPLFSTLSELFGQKTPGWGYTPLLNLRTKNETCVRKTSTRPPSLPLPLCHRSKMPLLDS